VDVPEGWDLERWVEVTTALSQGASLAEVLERHGIDEDTWAVVDDAFDAMVSTALADESDEDELAPPLLERLAAAQAAARDKLTQGPGSPSGDQAPLSFEAFVALTRSIVASGDPVKVLGEARITPMLFAQANQHWARRMAQDPPLAERFAAEIGKPS
jgi:hypothetical protein